MDNLSFNEEAHNLSLQTDASCLLVKENKLMDCWGSWEREEGREETSQLQSTVRCGGMLIEGGDIWMVTDW